jgi:DNA-directed RNA polymerase specialized sigma subunit
MPLIDDAGHFQNFTKVVERAIAKYGHLKSEDMTALQCKQVEELARLEVEFRKALIRDPNGEAAYLAFIAFVLDEKKNILAARPYFRCRRPYFASHVSKAIRKRNVKVLQRYHINYQCVNFMLSRFKFGPDVNSAIKKIQYARQQLVVMNIPLVISRATIFWSRTHRSHLTFMDLVQIGVEGLVSAIDKYCGEYSKVWRGVAIGRMVGNFIENFSSTMLHFYPADKRKLYRANKFKSRHIHGDYDTADLVKEVSKAEGNETNEEEIISLMAASSVVSADSSIQHEADDETKSVDNIAKYAAPEESRPDLQVEEREAHGLMRKAIGELQLIDQKLLRLRGLTF